MNLNNFESHINPVIFERGYGYYETGAVTSIKETDNNVWEAEVEGSDTYTVDVELDARGDIIYTVCDCPYDMGEYCKHQVAVFLTLRDLMNKKAGQEYHGQFNNKQIADQALQQTVPAEKKMDINLRRLLSERTKEELVNLLVGIAFEYEDVMSRIELSFNAGTEKDELKKSVALIRSYINKYCDNDDYIDYYDTPKAVKGAEMVLDNARYYIEMDKVEHAVDLALCVLREMVNLIENADDSDDAIGFIISQCFDLINEIIAGTNLTAVCKESILDKLLREDVNPLYSGWPDWRLDLLNASVRLADNPRLREKVEERLASVIHAENKGDNGDDNFAEQIHLIRYGIIDKFDGAEKGIDYIKQNIAYPEFRKMAIEAAFSEQNYDEVIRITQDGETQDQDKPGLVNRWRECRFKAYKQMGKVDQLRELAMSFILSGSIEYYRELKSTYNASEWPDVYPGIILALEEKQRTIQPVYTEILIEEGEKEKLLDYVKKDVSRVRQYYNHLVPEYSDIVYKMFRQYIEYCAELADSRNKYKGVCAIIRDLKKAGGRTQATEIKEMLVKKYPRKKAFQDELSRV